MIMQIRASGGCIFYISASTTARNMRLWGHMIFNTDLVFFKLEGWGCILKDVSIRLMNSSRRFFGLDSRSRCRIVLRLCCDCVVIVIIYQQGFLADCEKIDVSLFYSLLVSVGYRGSDACLIGFWNDNCIWSGHGRRVTVASERPFHRRWSRCLISTTLKHHDTDRYYIIVMNVLLFEMSQRQTSLTQITPLFYEVASN